MDDRGYNDYRLFGSWSSQEVFFVTRMKDKTLYEVTEERTVPKNRNILKDEIILLTGAKAAEKCSYYLRLVTAYDPEKEQEFVFLTNNLYSGSLDHCRHL